MSHSDGRIKATLSEEEQSKLNKSLYDSASDTYGSIEDVKEALSLGADVNYTDSYGTTALFVASFNGDTEIVILLLKHHADPNISDASGLTPLHVADNKDIAKLLVNNGANVTALFKGQFGGGMTPLHTARSKDIAEYLIKNGANINVLTEDRSTVLHTVCQSRGDRVIVLIDYLIQKGLSVESRNKYGETPLHFVCNERIAKHLVDRYGADINAIKDNGDTILHAVFNSNSIEDKSFLTYLIETKGLKLDTLNKSNQTPIDILNLRTDTDGTGRIGEMRMLCLMWLMQKGYYNLNDAEKFKNAVARKGSVTYLMVQCMPFGPPRVGKTCLYNLLINKPSPGVPTTKKKLGSGSLSTDALTGRTIINASVGYRDTAKAITATGSTWSEVPSLDEEIAMMVNTTKQQFDGSKTQETLQRSNFVSSVSKEQHSSIVLDQSLDTGNPENTQNREDLESVQLVKKKQKKMDAVTEEAILESITGPITYGRVKADQVQGLLKDSLTIFYTDTGGQPEFQEVLPALVAGPTIFLLTFSLFTPKEVKRFILPNKLIPSDPLNALYQVRYHSSEDRFVDYESSFTVKEVLLQCLSSISCFKDGQINQLALNNHDNTSTKPTQVRSAPPISVLIIGTHHDLVQQEDVEKVDQSLRESLANIDLMDKGLIEEYESQKQFIIPINNHDPSDAEKVRQVLERIIRRVDENGESPYKIELPLHWLGLELYLRKSDRSTIKYSECKAIARSLDIPVNELGDCLKYLHFKTGTIRYYDGVEELKDIVIVKPSVIFSAITKLITSTFVPNNVKGNVQRYFTQYGLFKQSEIQRIFTDNQQSLQLTLDQFLALLRHLNILSRAYQMSSEGEEQFDYFLPCALTHAPIAREESTDSAAVASNPLLVSFKSGFVPKGIFSGLLAYFTGQLKWEIMCDKNHHPLLYRNQATLSVHQEMCSVTMRAKAKFLEFSLEFYKKSTSATESMPVLHNVQEKIKEALSIECNTLKYGQNWKLGVYCSECQTAASDHVAVVDAVRKTGYCPVVRRQFYLTDNQCSWFTPSPTTHQVAALQDYNRLIANCFDQPEYENVQGIIIVVGMLGATGTAVDVDQISATFKELGFAVLRCENLTSEDLVNLIRAAAAYDYPILKRFRFFAFYFAGHGGADGDDNLFINTAPTTADPKPILHIEPHIIEPLKDLNIPCRLFMFDCCQSPGTGQAYHNLEEEDSSKKPQRRPQQVIAFAVSKGQKAIGNKDQGGLWTHHLCINIREKVPLVNVLAKTNGDVRRKSFQDPTFICSIDDTVVVARKGNTSPNSTQQQLPSIADEVKDTIPTQTDDSAVTHRKDGFCLETQQQKVECSTDQNQGQLLVKQSADKPVLNQFELFDLLSDKSAHWNEIGRALRVETNYRDTLRRDAGLDDDSCLERVIDKWLQSATSSPSWDQFITALKRLKYTDIIAQMEEQYYHCHPALHYLSH